uniref:Secreted protein n=1 Tax=Parascaris univalens TaxID=6257 RepID=A0A915CJ12_PARUN
MSVSPVCCSDTCDALLVLDALSVSPVCCSDTCDALLVLDAMLVSPVCCSDTCDALLVLDAMLVSPVCCSDTCCVEAVINSCEIMPINQRHSRFNHPSLRFCTLRKCINFEGFLKRSHFDDTKFHAVFVIALCK